MGQFWEFYAYESPEHEKAGKYFFMRTFFDFNEMKSFSAEHSRKHKEKYPNYCSDYKRFDQIAI